MDRSIVILLLIILMILVILNNLTINIISTSNGKSTDSSFNAVKCPLTVFGCCPDGVNSKIDWLGSNCPRFDPGPGYK
jgi:hypothetical protein